jgi:Holliday junction resolvase RusA-like endonuclease
MLIFTVHEIPQPQVQTRFRSVKGRIFTYNPSKPYIDRIKWQLKAFAPSNPLLGAIEMTLSFFLPIPKTTSRIKRTQMIAGKILHIKKPDTDNLAYAVTNACKGIIYRDDSQIVRLIAQKMYSEEPKIVIKIRELADTIFNFNLGEGC